MRQENQAQKYQRRKTKDIGMDKKIKKMEKETSKVGKDLKKFEKADKKRDHLVEKGKMMKKKGC
jgi:hypothetical protein